MQLEASSLIRHFAFPPYHPSETFSLFTFTILRTSRRIVGVTFTQESTYRGVLFFFIGRSYSRWDSRSAQANLQFEMRCSNYLFFLCL